MTPADVKALIEKWRELAKAIESDGWNHVDDDPTRLESCADELEDLFRGAGDGNLQRGVTGDRPATNGVEATGDLLARSVTLNADAAPSSLLNAGDGPSQRPAPAYQSLKALQQLRDTLERALKVRDHLCTPFHEGEKHGLIYAIVELDALLQGAGRLQLAQEEHPDHCLCDDCTCSCHGERNEQCPRYKKGVK
jgi:hypothetical protein